MGAGILRRKENTGTTLHNAYYLQPLSLSINSGNRHLLNTYCLSGAVLDAGSAEVNESRWGGHRWQTSDNHKEHMVVFSFYG